MIDRLKAVLHGWLYEAHTGNGGEHQVFNDFSIGDTKNLFDDQSANTDVHQRIRAGGRRRVEDTERLLIDCREQVFCKNLCP